DMARRFDTSSSDAQAVIATTALRQQLLALRSTTAALAKTIDSNRRLVSIRQSGSDEPIVVQLGRLLAFNMNIFLTEFTGGAKPIENLRKAFVSKESSDTKLPVNDLATHMEACLLSNGTHD